MALPPNALTTLEAVRAELGITDSSQDGLLERYIMAATEAIERLCDRKFHYEPNIVERVAGYGSPYLVLSRTPVVSITSIDIGGVSLPPSEYVLEDPEAGLVYRRLGWPHTSVLRGGVTWDRLPGGEEPSITVTYSGGYVTPQQALLDTGLQRTLPYDLEQLCIDAVVALYRDRGVNKAIVAERLDGAGAVQYQRGTSILPPSVIEGLKPWMRFGQA